MEFTGETQVLRDIDASAHNAPTEPLVADLSIQIGAILASAAEASLPRDSRALLVALPIIIAGAMKLGWKMRELWGPVYDNRGWGALLVLSIVVPIFLIWRSNTRGAS